MERLEELKIQIVQEEEKLVFNNEDLNKENPNPIIEHFYFVVIATLAIIRFFSFIYLSI
jgi:hypothetical protein